MRRTTVRRDFSKERVGAVALGKEGRPCSCAVGDGATSRAAAHLWASARRVAGERPWLGALLAGNDRFAHSRQQVGLPSAAAGAESGNEPASWPSVGQQHQQQDASTRVVAALAVGAHDAEHLVSSETGRR